MPYPPRKTELLVRVATKAHKIAVRSNHEEMIHLTRLTLDGLKEVDETYNGAIAVLRLAKGSETLKRRLDDIDDDDLM